MDDMTPRQLGFSSFAALAAPMTVLCAGLSWPAALLGLAVGGVGFQVLCSAADHGVRMAAPLRGAYLLWCLLLLGRAMDMSSLCYPSQTDYVPVVLLALAITAAYAGAGTCGRLGAVLWPALIVLLGGLLAFALSDLRWAWGCRCRRCGCWCAAAQRGAASAGDIGWRRRWDWPRPLWPAGCWGGCRAQWQGRCMTWRGASRFSACRSGWKRCCRPRCAWGSFSP